MFFAVFCRKNAQFLRPIVGKVLNKNLLLKIGENAELYIIWWGYVDLNHRPRHYQ